MLFIELLAVIKYLKPKIRYKFMYVQHYYNIAL